jgi:hypothetical protein
MYIVNWFIIWIESIWVDSVSLLLSFLTTEALSNSLRSSSNSTWGSSSSISDSMSLSVRDEAANQRHNNNNSSKSTSSDGQSKECNFKITNCESFSIIPFSCWYNFIIPIGFFFTWFCLIFCFFWNIFLFISSCSCNPLSSNSELTHVILFDWISCIHSFRLEANENIILCCINEELLTELSLINWVVCCFRFTSRFE